jgi:RNA polymerase sigma factor (sigma-70 family)
LDELPQIVAACRKNDKEAQFRLYRMLAPQLMGICLRYMRHREEAEDVLQDTFVKIFTNLAALKNESSFEGWAKRIAVNTALSALKYKKRITFDGDLSKVEEEAADNFENDSLNTDELVSCLNTLPDGYRTIINLFLVEEYSHKEIAEKLGIRESTSRSQYSRALKALQQVIKKKSTGTLINNA